MSDRLVLCYHAVSESWPASLSITPRRLEEQLSALTRRGYRGTTFHDAVHAAPSRRTFAVTFDDAYVSVLELALPIMSRLGVPGTIFVPTDFVGSRAVWPGVDRWLQTAHEHELATMTWPQLRALADAGWEIGSHTCSHPRLTGLADTDLARELADSRRRCEDGMGRACRSLAYPYGDHDARVIGAAATAGYEAAGTLPEQFSGAAPLAWPRVGIYYEDTPKRFAVKVSPTVRRMRASHAWPRAARVLREVRRVGSTRF